MANMISVRWDNNRCQNKPELPQGWVFFTFAKGERPLWCDYSPNIEHRLEIIRRKAENDAQYAEMSSAADILHIESCARPIDALIRHKVVVQTQHPPYQHALDPSRDYVYLALDAYRYPFASLQSATNDDWTYLGPWRSRFFLADVMDSLSRILKIPFCETGTFPCEKLDNGICRGYCLALEDERNEAELPDLQKLDALLREAYLHPHNGILEMVNQQRDKYFDDLEFEKADLLDDEIANLGKYRDWLNFLYVSKELAFATPEIRVEGGMLRSCVWEGVEYQFPAGNTEYRENERLALNLSDVDEARVLYDYYIKNIKG